MLFSSPVLKSSGAVIDDVLGREFVSRRPPLIVLIPEGTEGTGTG